ncbi:MAG: hypothetical protein ACRDT6_18515 [Micromonosporaceae bacterium]
MTSTWSTYHRRYAVLNQVVRLAETHPGGELPWRDVPGATDAFADLGELLAALQQRWFTTLTAHLEQAVETGDDVADAVRLAQRHTDEYRPGLRLILDQHHDHPALRRARRRERAAVTAATDLATPVRPLEPAA